MYAFARGNGRLSPCSRFPVLRRPFEDGLRAAGLALLLTVAPCATLAAHEFTSGAITVDHPWSRATPPGSKVAAGYLVIDNAGSDPDRLLSVSGEIAGRAEIHEMAVDANGVMTMRPVADGVEIPAGGTAALKPGSFHIMFIDLKQPAKEGEPFKGTLTFERAGSIDVEFSVEAVGYQPGHDAHGG